MGVPGGWALGRDLAGVDKARGLWSSVGVQLALAGVETM